MLTPNQDKMAYEALLNTLKASGVIVQDAQPDWPMLIHIAGEYTDHLNQVKDKPVVEPMDPEQVYLCDTGINDQLVVYPAEADPGDSPTVAFVCEGMTGQGDNRASAILSMTDVRRLRDQLNQLLGE